jgi:hypothetical protein
MSPLKLAVGGPATVPAGGPKVRSGTAGHVVVKQEPGSAHAGPTGTTEQVAMVSQGRAHAH